MRQLVILFSLFVFCTLSRVQAQEIKQETDIYSLLRESSEGAGKVEIMQPRKLAEALSNYRARNAQHPGLDGFRVRIYRDLGKNARAESEAIMGRVLSQFEGLRAYRTFDSPYYKVSVGDCRTRFEAYVLRQRLLNSYPRAFVVTERINFPATN